jgi:hypothetical protein
LKRLRSSLHRHTIACGRLFPSTHVFNIGLRLARLKPLLSKSRLTIQGLKGLRSSKRKAIGSCNFELILIVSSIRINARIGKTIGLIIGYLLCILCGNNNPIIMFGMLKIALSHHSIARRMGITRELHIFLGNMLGCPPDLHIGPI